jgi:hypothetical protein
VDYIIIKEMHSWNRALGMFIVISERMILCWSCLCGVALVLGLFSCFIKKTMLHLQTRAEGVMFSLLCSTQ